MLLSMTFNIYMSGLKQIIHLINKTVANKVHKDH